MKKELPSQTKTILTVLLALSLAVNLFFGIYAFVGVMQINSFISSVFGTSPSEFAGIPAEENAEESPPTEPEPSAAEPSQAAEQNCVSGNIDIDTDPSIGSPNAPVVIVEYSDFECPFCARFVTGAYPQIKNQYVDTGLVRIVYKDFPLDNIHPLATPASLAANCVYNEFGTEAFFALHDRIYLQQGSLSNRNLENWAREYGLSAAQYRQCQNNSSMQSEITADRSEGIQLGITGTPSFVINGELLVGAQPFEVFKASIDAALNGSSQCSL